jgi:hypothetical protein
MHARPVEPRSPGAKTCGDHTHFRPVSATACHTFFCPPSSHTHLSAPTITKARHFCGTENSQLLNRVMGPHANVLTWHTILKTA